MTYLHVPLQDSKNTIKVKQPALSSTVKKTRKDIKYCITKTGTKHKNPQTSGAMRNNESTTTEPSPWNVQRLKPQGWIFTLDSAVVKTQHFFNFGSAYNLEYAALI